MSAARNCPKCGSELPEKGAQGLCPKCLLAVGLEAAPSTPGSEDVTIDSAAGDVGQASSLAPGAQRQAGTRPHDTLRYFGDYELLEEIARGGMGVVYKARQTSLNRTVAIKMILAGQLAGEADVQRFRTEAEAAASLQHPNIVAIHEVGEHDGQHYFSMDYVEGSSLADVIREHPLSAKQAADYVKTIAEAIHYAHEKGTLHRDLKPSNVLLDENAQPRITDFGLARRIESDSEMTATGQALGTPSYMPPEQAAGRRKEIGPASDVYSIGAILYELLTGRPPFRAESPLDTLMQVLENEPASPRALNPAVPKDLETICLKCLEKDSDQRYQNAADLTADLDQFLNDEPIKARPIGVLEQTWRRARKHHRLLKSIAAAVVLTVVLGVVGFVSWDRYREEQIALLTLKTDGYPLTAELLDENEERVIRSFTIPTEAPVEVWGGDYRLRASAPGMLSQTYQLTLQPDLQHEFNIDLAQQRLWPPLGLGPKDHFELIDLDGPADVIVREDRFGKTTLRRLDGTTLDSLWELPLGADSARAGEASTTVPESVDAAQWQKFINAWQTAGPRHNPHNKPLPLEPAPDLNGDGVGDLVFFSGGFQNEPPLLAVSGADGKVLWLHVSQADAGSGSSYVMVTRPVAVDVDGDDRLDIVTAYARRRGLCRVEAISGSDGRVLWSQSPGELNPASGNAMPLMNDDTGEIVLSFPWEFLPLSPLSMEGEPAIVLLTDQKVVSFRPADGETAMSPIDLSDVAWRPLLVRVGSDAALLVAVPRPNPQSPVPQFDLSLRRLTGESTWTIRHMDPNGLQPLVVDLDGDGNDELVVSRDDNTGRRPRWSVAVLDAADGQDKWERIVVPNWDWKCKQFLDCPDIDGDGWQEVVVVSTGPVEQLPPAPGGLPQAVFIDVLSGKDGGKISGCRGPLLKRPYPLEELKFESAEWGQPDADGYPQLLITLLGAPDPPAANWRRVHFISPLKGIETHRVTDVQSVQQADVNGNGLPDLCITRQTREGAELQVLAAAPPAAWRRLGDLQPAQDYNGDGLSEAIEVVKFVAPRIRLFSGSDGRLLSQWMARWNHPQTVGAETISTPPLPDGDFNGDGVPDLLLASKLAPLNGRQPDWSTPQAFPLQVLSGATGQRIWIGRGWTLPKEIEQRNPKWTTLSVASACCGDLDGNDGPEVICVHGVYWREKPQGQPQDQPVWQLWLTVLSGQDGRVVWTAPLSDPAGQRIRGMEDLVARFAHTKAAVAQHPAQIPQQLDLNGDGVLDLVATVPKTLNSTNADAAGCEIRAISGREGSQLWPPFQLKTTFEGTVAAEDLPEAAVGDLDGDGRPEVVVAERVANKSGPDTLRVLVIGGAEGKLQWEWTGTDSTSKPIARVALANLDGDGKQCVVTRYYEGPQLGTQRDTLVVLDHTGALRAQTRADGVDRARIHVRLGPGGTTSATGAWWANVRVWPIDINGDGRDELVYPSRFADGDRLIAASGNGEVLWERPLPDQPFVETVVASQTPPVLVVGNGQQSYYGLNAVTGEVLWRGDGLRRGEQSARPTHNWCLPLDEQGDSPRLMTRRDEVIARACLPTAADGSYATAGLIQPGIALDLTARTDPRVARKLPWDHTYGIEDEFIAFCLCSAALVLLPGFFFYQMLRHRRWDLRTWLTVPLVIAWMILAFRAFQQVKPIERFARPDLAVLSAAAVGTVYNVFPVLLIVWCARHRWLRATALVASALVLTAVIAAIMVYEETTRLDATEQLVWTWNGIGNLILPATAMVGCVALLLTAVVSFVRWIRRRHAALPEENSPSP